MRPVPLRQLGQELHPGRAIKTAPILGTTLGEENTYGAMAGRTPAGLLTFGRVSTDDAHGVIRTYVGEGHFTDDPLATFGTRAVVQVPGLQKLLKYVCKNGFEHHVAMNASHTAGVLAEAFATYFEWEVHVHGASMVKSCLRVWGRVAPQTQEIEMTKLRIGIIGCGEVTQIMHLPSLTQLSGLFTVTALCDVSNQVLHAVGDHWNVPKRYLDYRDLVAQADVDAVLVANPDAYHAPATLAAIAAGKHVLVEKPMCISLQEADAIIAAQASAGVTVQVGYMRRYAPAFVEACRLVPELGPIRLARVHDVLGWNSLFIKETSHVVRGDDIPADVLAEGKQLREERTHRSAWRRPCPSARRLRVAAGAQLARSLCHARVNRGAQARALCCGAPGRSLRLRRV